LQCVLYGGYHRLDVPVSRRSFTIVCDTHIMVVTQQFLLRHNSVPIPSSTPIKIMNQTHNSASYVLLIFDFTISINTNLDCSYRPHKSASLENWPRLQDTCANGHIILKLCRLHQVLVDCLSIPKTN